MRNPDIELQQRAIEYLQLTSIASTDVLATVLEEMPPFPERESSILAKLKKKKPGAMSVDEQNADGAGGAAGDDEVGKYVLCVGVIRVEFRPARKKLILLLVCVHPSLHPSVIL